MKKKQGIIVLILAVVFTALLIFTSAVGFGPTGTGAARNIILGLDLSGGVSITYQAKEDNPSAEDMSDTIYKLQQRVEGYSEEAQVYQEGNNRINIEIPGVSDANAILEELGKPGSLEFTDPEGNVVLEGLWALLPMPLVYELPLLLVLIAVCLATTLLARLGEGRRRQNC